MMEEVKGMGEKQESIVNYFAKLHTIIVAYFIWECVFFFDISKKTFPSSNSTLSCNGSWWVILGLSCSCSFVYILLFLNAALLIYHHENQLYLILQKHAQQYPYSLFFIVCSCMEIPLFLHDSTDVYTAGQENVHYVYHNAVLTVAIPNGCSTSTLPKNARRLERWLRRCMNDWWIHTRTCGSWVEKLNTHSNCGIATV